MQHRRLRFGRGFRVLFDCRGVQAAQMVIAPGGRCCGHGIPALARRAGWA